MLPSTAIAEDLERYRQEFSKYLGDQSNITEMLDFLRQSKGKAIRPQLLLTLCALFGCQDAERFKIAVATEYIHTASLIHDDIIDAATSRRNQDTLHNKWSVKDAILIGDFLYSRAFELICQTKHGEVLGLFANAANRLSISEINQLEINEGNGNKKDMVVLENEEICLSIAKEKTAVLFAVVCEAAILISTKQTTQELGVKAIAEYRTAASNYGMNLGMAFQLMDDHLDYSATSDEWGKKRLQDISEGKVTLPLVYLYQSSNNAEKDYILNVLQQKSSSAEDMENIDNKIKASSALTQVESMTKDFTEKALESLDILTASATNKDSEYHEYLKSLVLSISSRDH